MDKIGEIREGVTPPECHGKSASEAAGKDLESHVTQRLADAATAGKEAAKAGKSIEPPSE